MSTWRPSVARAYAQLGEQAHVPILYDALAPLVGDLRGRTLLDFGCGDGRLTARFAEHAPRHVLAIDQSPELLDTARAACVNAPTRISFELGDESLLPAPGPFDIALCSLMLMMCETRERLARSVGGLIESLSPDGRALLVLTHPCFRGEVHAAFHNALPEGFDYWQSGRPYRVVLDPEEQQVATTFHDYHWTLGDYAATVAVGGGVVRQMVETPGQYDAQGRPVGDPAYLTLVVGRG